MTLLLAQLLVNLHMNPPALCFKVVPRSTLSFIGAVFHLARLFFVHLFSKPLLGTNSRRGGGDFITERTERKVCSSSTGSENSPVQVCWTRISVPRFPFPALGRREARPEALFLISSRAFITRRLHHGHICNPPRT